MSLTEHATKDIQQITSNLNEWGINMTFTAPDEKTANVNGLHTKHHLGVDTDGATINSKTAHVSVSEKFFNDADYPVRGPNGEVSMIGHKVDVKDSTGITKNYIVGETFPDEKIGLIIFILKDYE